MNRQNDARLRPGDELYIGITCTGCARCVYACPKNCFKVVGSIAMVDQTNCDYCGECLRVCPSDAVKIDN